MAPLLGTPKDMYRKVRETGIPLNRSPLGNLEGDSFSRDFDRWIRWAPETEQLLLWEHC